MTEDTTIDRLLGMARDLAARQYPDDIPGRQEYHIGLLEQRIREIAARPILDLNVFDQVKAYGAPVVPVQVTGSIRPDEITCRSEVFDPFKGAK